jgi:hypothetical protein
MCRKSVGKVNFPRKIRSLLVLSTVYNIECKEIIMAAELVDCMAILVAARRFIGMDATDSRSLRSIDP